MTNEQNEKFDATEELIIRLRAGFSLVWFRTDETLRAANTINKALEEYTGEKVIVWDCETEPDPMSAIEKLDAAPSGTTSIFINYHWFLKSIDGANQIIVQMLKNRAEVYSSAEQRKAIVIISHLGMNDGLPDEIKPDFTAIDFSLPGEKAINDALDYAIDCVKENPKFKAPNEKERVAIINAAKGLTQKEIENAFIYSVVTTGGEIRADLVTKIKAKIVENEAGLEYSTFPETFESLKGYDVLKKFTKATIGSEHAKGILLLGPPGTGKSHFCKCLGNETGLPVLSFEFGAVFGSLVGESEKKIRRVIEIIKAMAPCIVFVDEIEKGLAGARGGSTDGGTTQRTTAIWLKFMSDRPKGIYIVATCNDISSIPPEYLRAERWDTAPFFIDLPNDDERPAILDHYKNVYGVNGKTTAKELKGWSGAEIKALCRIASMMNVSLDDARQFVVPISTTMKEEIERLRKWSEGRTLQASADGVQTTGAKPKRSVDI